MTRYFIDTKHLTYRTLTNCLQKNMSNDVIIYIISLAALFGVIAFLILERASIVDQHRAKEDKLLEENSRLVKAIIAKNANDYVMTTSIDKVAPEEKPAVNSDLIDPDSLTDDEFDKTLGIKRTQPKK